MRFAVYKHQEKLNDAVVRVGFSWWACLFTWLWAFINRLWVPGILLLVAEIVLGCAAALAGLGGGRSNLQLYPLLPLLLYLPVRIFAGLKASEWKRLALERRGYTYRGQLQARSQNHALLQAKSEELFKHEATLLSSRRTPVRPTSGLKGMAAITSLTWKAAFRFRLFWVVASLLLIAVIGLPLLVKDDGTARGFTQLLITYTLGAISALLGLCTLWLACGTLARDIEECQVQVVAVKPIARWQIWLGKWLGIMSLDAALLLIAGTAVYGLLLWRATRLPDDQQKVLHNEVLVARGSAQPDSVDSEINTETDRILAERLQKNPAIGADLKQVRNDIREQRKALRQVVPPGYYKQWQLKLGLARHSLKDQPLYLRVKFNAAQKSASGTFDGVWEFGVPRKTAVARVGPLSQAPDTFHEFEIPPNLFDEEGVLTVRFFNVNDSALLFPLEDGMEVLYREGGFGLNYVRGLGIILCWMGLLAALGLASASFLSFPVAAFFSLGLLTMVLCSGTMAEAVDQGTIAGYNSEKGTKGWTPADVVVIPTFRAALKVIGLAKNFSPVDALSTGRSITWEQLGLAFLQIVGVLGGILAAFGMTVFTRRELATAQGTQ